MIQSITRIDTEMSLPRQRKPQDQKEKEKRKESKNKFKDSFEKETIDLKT